MKNCLSLLLLLVSGFVFNQFSAQIFKDKEAKMKVDGSTLVKVNKNRNSIDYVKLSKTSRISELENLDWLTKKVLKINPDFSFQFEKKETDKKGFTHFKYNQYYKNLLVEYGVYNVHVERGLIESANGEFYSDISVSINPEISKDSAFVSALNVVNSERILVQNGRGLTEMKNEGKLLILPVKNGFKLAYKFDIYSQKPLKRVYVYIDAQTGQKIKEINRIHHTDVTGTANTAYNGTVSITTDQVSESSFRLRSSMGFGGVSTFNMNNGTNYGSATDFTDTDNIWNSTGSDMYAYDAHFGAQATYNYFFNRFGRNSYDNAGASINSYVHYDFDFVNAFWDGTQMTYGDGDGIDYTALTSIDVVGHEITHAVTEYTAGLVYADESGALNESFSDCFGVAIDYANNPTTANFDMGDQFALNGIPFRGMANPNDYGNPDTYGGTYWNNPNEVHNNSGVQNFWFYLISMGGSGVNDLGDSYSINAIGIDKAGEIAYRNLSTYLTPNSTHEDARFYSIQAAIDLYGECSEEVIQVTNAWFAVGVGEIYSNDVVSNFIASQNYFCTLPANVTFTNTSVNGSTYFWEFGDGGTSALTSPTHTYSSAGTYSVSLQVQGTSACSSSDTLILSNLITVSNGGGPASSTCSPATVAYCCNVGVSNLSFATINKTSSNATEGYRDFSCSDATTVTAGDIIPISITTGSTYNENVKVWIDYNNDGAFNNTNELVFTSINKLINHSGYVSTSNSAVLNTPLRMRIIDDRSTYTIADACYAPQNGQVEDYTITFIANVLPPEADFTANMTTINTGGTINFTDLTQHSPTSWSWTFTGASSTSSSLQNPTITYNTLGIFPVKLVVTNSFGEDSITKTAYVNVVNAINLCSGITSTTATSGQLYDSGGPTGNYQNSEFCTLLIDPGCALSVTLAFTQFSGESCCDYFRVYNGINNSAPLIGTFVGTTIPGSVTANSGTMFIQWSSDGSVIGSGFQATWSSVVGTGVPPVADFSISSSNPALATPVQFTDLSTEVPVSWLWNFGDGNTATVQNPSHAFTNAGTYTVTLIAYNCVSSDTITQTITTQGAPIITLHPDSIAVSLAACSDSITVPMYVLNTGTGDLSFNVSGNSTNSSPNVLSFNHGVDMTEEYINTISAINQYYTDYTLINTATTDPTTLETLLEDVDVLLFPENESGTSSVFTSIATVVQNFANNGGTVIVCGSSTTPINLYSMGLFSGTFNTFVTGTCIIGDTTIDIANNVNTSFSSSNASFTHNFTNTDVVSVATLNSDDLVAYRNIGDGKAVFVGFDYYESENNAKMLLSNAVRYHNSNVLDSWIQIEQIVTTVSPGDSALVNVTFYSTDLESGVYTSNIVFNSNDPLNSMDSLSVTMTVGDNPCVGFDFVTPSDCSGIVNFENTSLNSSSWTWSFGDGDVSSLENPSHTYANAGTYQVELIVCNNGFCDSMTQALTIISTTGPVSAFCSPQTTGNCCGMGIRNVTINTINNTSADGSIGYQDYSCTINTNLVVGESYTLNVMTGTQYNENVVAWIDYNNDGVFNTTDEKVFTSLNILTNHTGTITIPATTFLNTPLRMRIGSEYYSNSVPLSCNNVTYGQFEDYSIIIAPNTNPPVVDFSVSGLTDCDGIAQFTDQTQYAPSSWTWYFGDGNTSNLQNPSHTYASSGTYQVELVVCNNISCDSMTQSINYITSFGPIDAFCSPQTTGNCCGMGIRNVTFNTINNTSADGSIGYQDYSCTINTNLVVGESYTLNVMTGTQYNENVVVWIDYNNDGVFNTTNEKVFTSLNLLTNHTGTITIPATAILNTFLRMRIGSEYYNNSVPLSCNNVTYGQFEDYSIFIAPNTNPPVVDFSVSGLTNCDGIIQFTDETQYVPSSWTWNFGDGNTSDLQNPTHTYSSSGTYQVELVVCNTISCDSMTQSINYTVTSGPIAASCTPQTTGYCCGIGITNVNFNTINNTSLDGSIGYQDYSCNQSTSVVANEAYTINVTTGTGETENVVVWIDYNNDGAFNTTNEQVFVSLDQLTNHTGTITISGTSVLNTPLRMRIASDPAWMSQPIPCLNASYGQFEDYSITIAPNTNAPIVDFAIANPSNCNGAFQFTDETQYAQGSWAWNFGDGSTSNIQNPTHSYANSGTYEVELVVCNNISCDSMTQTVNYTLVVAPIPASCSPQTTGFCCGMGITNLTLNTINNTTSSGVDGYKDYTCSINTNLISGQNYNIHVGTGTQYRENVVAWIDYNNDGVFNTTNEKVFTSLNIMTNHNGVISVPTTAVLNTPLRMRVGSDYYSNTEPSSCTSVTYGQFEDYSITITPNTLPPNSNFTQTINDCDGNVSFTDLSTNGVTSWLWNFGDGNSSTLQNPTHQYTNSGTYEVKLFAENPYGTDSAVVSIIVDLISTDISTIGILETGSTIQFVSSNASSTTYNWNFGNGTFSSMESPFYSYSTPGTYYVSLVMTDGACSYTAYDTLIIVPNSLPPNSGFTQTIGNCNGNVQFNDLSTNNATSWLWNFGDGSSSSLQNPIHQYISSGTYQVKQFASNSNGTDSTTHFISVVVTITEISTLGVLETGEMIQFVSSNTTSSAYTWNFGTGTFSNLLSPNYSYSSPGTYYVSLIISNGTCSYTAYDTLVILPVSISGLSEFNNESNFNSYPNPFNNEMNISYELAETSKVSLKVVDLIGQTVQEFEVENSQKAGKYSYVFNPKPTGVYFLHYTVNGKTHIYKVTKVN